MPALTIAFALTPILVRTYAAADRSHRPDYVTTGRATGIARRYLPSATCRETASGRSRCSSINVGYLIGGTVVAEQIFGSRVGSLLSDQRPRDYAIIQLATLGFAILVVLANPAADLPTGSSTRG